VTRELEARAAGWLSGLVKPLPRRWALALGRGLGRTLADLDERHVAIAVDNLRRSFPGWDAPRLWRTARAVYAHFGEVLVDLIWLSERGREEILSRVDVVGAEHVRAAYAAGRGVLYPTGHFGHWELHAVVHGWVFEPVSVVARALDNPALDARLVRFRTLSGNDVIYKQHAVARVLRALKQNRGVAILIDQNVQLGEGIFVEFFGRPASTTTLVAALAVKTGCAVVPVRSEFLPRERVRLIYEPLEWKASGDRQADIHALTQQLTSRIEGWIRVTPERWLWMHRRWKTRPPEAA